MLRTTNSEFGPVLSMKNNLPTANSTLTKVAVQCSADPPRRMVIESSVLQTNFCAKKSATSPTRKPLEQNSAFQ